MRETLDTHDLYYYVEGMAKYGDAQEAMSFCMQVLPFICDDTRECLRCWVERDLGYIYGHGRGAQECSREQRESFEAFLRVYDLPITNTEVDNVEVDMDMEHLKCFVLCKGHGSHLRQEIWEWLIARSSEIPDHPAFLQWLMENFDEKQLEFVGGDYNYCQCLARFNPECQYMVEYDYRLGRQKGTKREETYLFHDRYWVNARSVIKDWSKGRDFLRIKNIEKI